MDDELFEYGKSLLERLIVFMSDNGGKLWEIAVKQAQVSGIQNIFGGIIALSFTVLMVIFIIKYASKLEELIVLPIIGIVISLALSCAAICDGVCRLLNPEWYAIKMLIDHFR